MSEPDLQPVLEGDLVRVRPIRESDWAEMFAAASDPLIWEGHPVQDRYTEPVFRDFFDTAVASGSAFAILDRGSGRIIGSSRYHGYDPQRSEVEIGWTFLVRACWGGVYNREVKTLMLDHAFKFVDTVIFMVGETNARSRGAMQKIGGVLRPGLVERGYSGPGIKHVVFEIRRPGSAPG